ncbi:MAG: hypothetical protein SGI92_05300 [Bryobacteraceae bacterium]|nr:hypothetical protein [Bryobacteraceae bacterium]
MSDTVKDPLVTRYLPDRVFYATGAMLGAEDFSAEQTYHRGRLARAAKYLHGSGTLAGLNVEYKPAAGTVEEEIVVHPGIAIDRLGRMIEVPSDACIRLGRWYRSQQTGDLFQGFHAADGGVLVDLFVRFVPCERSRTPAFASGPFDALDAVVPSRLRDAYRLELVIRKEPGAPPLPVSRWPDLAAIPDPAARRTALHEAILTAWTDGTDSRDDDDNLERAVEQVEGQDTTSLFLARLTLPATSGSPPARTAGANVPVDNLVRQFVYATDALPRWLGA